MDAARMSPRAALRAALRPPRPAPSLLRCGLAASPGPATEAGAAASAPPAAASAPTSSVPPAAVPHADSPRADSPRADSPHAGGRARPAPPLPASPAGLPPRPTLPRPPSGHGLGRRTWLGVATALLAGLPACGAQAPGAPRLAPDDPAAQWLAFRARFLQPDGRVADTGQGGISHSEGQGYGMLFAEAFDDLEAFERMLAWTRRHLRRADHLHAWRFRPGQPVPVDDPNNATDGDLYIAWALLRGAERWGRPDWRREAQAIGGAVLRLAVREVGGRTLLLPGAFGFDHPDRVVVNPSYYAFPALAALARAVPDRAWGRVMADGVALLRAARHGRWGLTPDWAELDRAAPGAVPQPARGWPARFSFDAVRVPLHLAWAGMAEEPAARAAAGFWNDPFLPVRPAWADLRTGQIAPYAAPSGIEAVAEATTAAHQGRAPGRALPAVARSPDYYSAALSILARLALKEAPPRPVQPA